MGFTDGRKITGLYRARVESRARISPNLVRITFAGDDLARLPQRGFDQWFRLFLPIPGGVTDFSAIPEGFGLAGYLKYLTAKSGTRPPFRNYTIRTRHGDGARLDVDFVAHGSRGIAGPWAQRAEPGEEVVLLDQGRGFDPPSHTDSLVIAGDESALPAIAGILRDLPRDAAGLALIELPCHDDAQQIDAPPGVDVRFLARRAPTDRPGALALDEVRRQHPRDGTTTHAYLAGEQALVAGSRRHLVSCGVPKSHITFTGYWKVGRAG